MKVSVIEGYDSRRLTLPVMLVGGLITIAGALYVGLNVLPPRSLSLLSYLLPAIIALTIILVWQPKLAVPMIIVSVFFSPDIVLAQIPGRGVNLRVEDGVLLAVLLALVIRHAVGRDAISFARTPLDKPILTYCAVGLVSTLVGMYLGNVSPFRGFFFFAKRVEYFLLFYLLCFCLEEEREIKLAIYLILICALGISIHGIYMRITSPQVSPWGFSPLGGSTRTNEYAEILALIIPIVITIAFEKHSFAYILAAPFVVFFMTYFLADTLRRTAMVGVAWAILFLAVYKYRALIPLLALAVLYFSVRLPENIAERVNLLWFEVTQYPYPGGSLAERVIGVETAMSNWLYRPLIGNGLGTYRLGTVVAHNQYAHILLETGILGLGAFLWFIASTAKICWKGMSNTTNSLYRGLCIGFLAGILGWLIMNLGTVSFTSIRTMNCFIIMTAILVGYSRISVLDKHLWR